MTAFFCLGVMTEICGGRMIMIVNKWQEMTNDSHFREAAWNSNACVMVNSAEVTWPLMCVVLLWWYSKHAVTICLIYRGSLSYPMTWVAFNVVWRIYMLKSLYVCHVSHDDVGGSSLTSLLPAALSRWRRSQSYGILNFTLYFDVSINGNMASQHTYY